MSARSERSESRSASWGSAARVGVTAPDGFRAAGVRAGLKSGGARDVALVVNDGPGRAAAGVFTRNRVQAAPVRWSAQVLRAGVLRAVVLNSGGANACTGPAGFQDAHTTAEHVATALTTFVPGAEVGAGEVAVCSTGLIGQRLPMGRLLAGVNQAAAELSPSGGAAAAEAIMTTDSRPKAVALRVDGEQLREIPPGGLQHPPGEYAPGSFTIGGMAKGAGMLAPSLATMLCVLTTDAVADAAALDAALREAVRVTFERLDSDGCLSTNDTVLLLASGAAGVAPSQGQLTAAVTAACQRLVRQLLADAEGATKQVAIEVQQAASEQEAVEVARAVARNNLVKTAMFGNDPNWGRILAAVGTTSAAFDPDALDVTVNGVQVCHSGAGFEDPSRVDLSGPEVTVQVVLHAGDAAATVWTNDLSHGYVHENSAYST